MDTFKFEVGDITINTVIQAFIGIFLFVLTIMFNVSNNQGKEANRRMTETNKILTKLTSEVAKLNTLTESNRVSIQYVGKKSDDTSFRLNNFIINHKETH